MGEATDRPDSPNVLDSQIGDLVEASEAVLPLPAICLAALRLHHQAQAAVKDAAGPFWIPTGHLFTTPRRSAP